MNLVMHGLKALRTYLKMPRPKKLDLEKVLPIIEDCVRHKESKVKIAKKLNISRNTLHYWIANYPEVRRVFEDPKDGWST